MIIGQMLISNADRTRLADKTRKDLRYVEFAENIDAKISELECQIEKLEEQKREKFKEVMILNFMENGAK